MTAAPQTISSGTSRYAGPPYANAARTQQVPLTSIAPAAARARPNRSPTHPASRQPSAPQRPRDTKTTSPTVPRPGSDPREARLAVRNAGAHAHSA